jgi:hypothetical protein
MLIMLHLALLATQAPAPATKLEQLVVQGDSAAAREIEEWVNRSRSDERKMEQQLTASGFTREALDDCTNFTYSGKSRRTRDDRAADIQLCPGRRATVSLLTIFPNFNAPNPMPPIVPHQSASSAK